MGVVVGADDRLVRRLHDPTLFDSGLEPILREVVGMVIDRERVIVNWKFEKIDLSLDQKGRD